MKTKNHKRILSVTVKRMIDESPDTSMLGKYGSRLESDEYSIDRAHDLDCIENDYFQRMKLQRIADAIENDRPICEDHIHVSGLNCEVCAEEKAYTDAMDEVRELEECDCGRGQWNHREYRFFNPNFENYRGDTPENIREYTRQDYERMERLNAGDWMYIGIQAEASVTVPSGQSSVESEITSGSVWGVESDGGKEYLKSIEQDELADLRGQLKLLGFSTRSISTAFKNVEQKEVY